mmetsp:Transcript_29854/g.30291  ORF Transcript_29854/g.30291 Transcript_29854/m.30291 type:complete len:582 (-) Transcript_29854:15-1760(-)
MEVIYKLYICLIILTLPNVILIFVRAANSTKRESIVWIGLGDWGKGGKNGSILSAPSRELLKLNNDDESHSQLTKTDEHGRKLEYTYQAPIASAMAEWANSSNAKPSFVLALGDNFYNDGVSSTTDSSWQTLWEEVYLDDYPDLNIPWYPVFGNHDYGYGWSGVKAQIDRTYYASAESESLWQFPATNYTKSFSIPGGGSVMIVFVDTTTLAPSENRCCNSEGGVSEAEQAARITNQLVSITNMLEETVENPPTWLLVAGHYPVYSEGEHGDTEELVRYLQPLLEKYNVHAYICGHDHISEHLQYGGIEYFVSGAGSMTDYLGDEDSNATLLWYGTGYSAFSTFEASLDSLTVSYRDYLGEIKYEYILLTNSSSSLLDNIQTVKPPIINTILSIITSIVYSIHPSVEVIMLEVVTLLGITSLLFAYSKMMKRKPKRTLPHARNDTKQIKRQEEVKTYITEELNSTNHWATDDTVHKKEQENDINKNDYEKGKFVLDLNNTEQAVDMLSPDNLLSESSSRGLLSTSSSDTFITANEISKKGKKKTAISASIIDSAFPEPSSAFRSSFHQESVTSKKVVKNKL